jgi:hypothetical protein
MADATNITRGLFGQRLSKRLPWMVDWFDPVLLGLVGIRTLISTTIGQYADQRPIQAAMDREDNRTTLALRHDFTGARAKELVLDKDGALWVDFIADLGDGYRRLRHGLSWPPPRSLCAAPYAGRKLDGGEILIFGGDLAYPNATVKGYQDRCPIPTTAFRRGQRESCSSSPETMTGMTALPPSPACSAHAATRRGEDRGWRCEQRAQLFRPQASPRLVDMGLDRPLRQHRRSAERLRGGGWEPSPTTRSSSTRTRRPG